MWKCNTCGRISENKIDVCPKCGQKTFTELTKEQEKLVKKSRITNDIHAEIISLLSGVLELSEVGIEENLDPPCVVLFNKQKKFCEEIIPSIKAELETHMKKGKWG